MATEYVVLSKRGTDGGWVEMDKKILAPSAKTAVKVALDGAAAGGEFVAIPARSWQPVKVQVETALKFS